MCWYVQFSLDEFRPENLTKMKINKSVKREYSDEYSRENVDAL